MPAEPVLRSLHDGGLAGWLGGSLANALALNPGFGEAKIAKGPSAVMNAGWPRWTPVSAAHPVGAIAALVDNEGRVVGSAADSRSWERL
jgi:hypothetical protein